MKYSAIILAGGLSKRFSKGDKCLIELCGKPLIDYVLDKTAALVDEVFIVVSSKEQLKNYSKIFSCFVKIIMDNSEVRSPLVGATAGFKQAAGEYSVLLPCDTPLISGQVLSLMINLISDHDAVIPRWPNECIEPLQAVYNTEATYASAVDALKRGELSLRAMVAGLKNILYLSTTAIRSIDADLHTFLNINDINDLRELNLILTSMKKA